MSQIQTLKYFTSKLSENKIGECHFSTQSRILSMYDHQRFTTAWISREKENPLAAYAASCISLLDRRVFPPRAPTICLPQGAKSREYGG
jgi:hypothetical protein